MGVINPDSIELKKKELHSYIKGNSDNFIGISKAIENFDKFTKNTEIEKGYIFDINNIPPKSKGSLFLNGVRCGSEGNITLISAGAGAGKSAVCERLISMAIATESAKIDTFGFSGANFKNILYIDTERTRSDFAESCLRALNYAGHTKEVPETIRMVCFSELSTIQERIEALIDTINTRECDLLIIDNVGDLCRALNDEAVSNETILWLTALIKKRNIVCLCTIHVNANSEKSRGHFGSELMRRAEAAFIVKSDKTTGTKTLTMDFSLGKNRSAVDNLTTNFRYNKEKMMFLSCDAPTKPSKTEGKNVEAIQQAYRDKTMYQYADLVYKLTKITGRADRTEKRTINSLIEMGVLVKDNDNYYHLNPEA